MESVWIETFLGKRINPFLPEPEQIILEDIAHSLAMQCRFNGHCLKFYSVAEHSVHVCEHLEKYLKKQNNLDTRIPLWGLLHDASEAYLCDIPRPLKKQFPRYLDWEKKLMDVIFAKFAEGIPSREEFGVVLYSDNVLLAHEASELTLNKGRDWGVSEYVLDKVGIMCWEPSVAKKKYIEKYESMCEKISS